MVQFRRSRAALAAAVFSLTWAWIDASAATNASAVAAPAAVHQHAHVHGVARMGVAIQDKTLTIQFESPLDSLIGFEHRAATPAQKAAVSALQARLRTPKDLFRFDAAAGCALTKSEAESAIFQPAPSGAVAGDEHADLDASFEFHCASPAQLMTLEVGLFEAFPRLKRIAVDVATDKGQFKRDLKSPQRTIALSR